MNVFDKGKECASSQRIEFQLQTEPEPGFGRLLSLAQHARLIYLLAFAMQPVRKKDAPRIARPALRYWKGKAPKGVAEAQDSDSDTDNAPQNVEPTDVPIDGLDASDNEEDEENIVPQQKVPKTMNVALRNVNISKEGKVIVDGKEESGRTLVEQGTLQINPLQLY